MARVGCEEMASGRHREGRDLGGLLGLALVGTLGYRHRNTFWRLQGLWAFLRGDRDWGTMERRGFGGDGQDSATGRESTGAVSR